MATRSEREKAFKLNEQHQNTLSKMLREEDNKYCADCEAKGTTFTLSVFFKQFSFAEFTLSLGIRCG